MFEAAKRAYNLKYALNCYRAFITLRDKEGEKEIFRHLSQLQKIISEPILAQKLLHEYTDIGLAAAIMLARYGYTKPLILPYPKQWRDYLHALGLRPHWMSRPLFIVNIMRKFIHGLACLKQLVSYDDTDINKWHNYIVFFGVPTAGLKIGTSEYKPHNFLSFARSKFTLNNLIFVNNDNTTIDSKVYLSKFPFPPLKTNVKKCRFCINSFLHIIKSVIHGVMGQWVNLYMSQDIFQAEYVKVLDYNDLPKKIIYTNSHYIYKPLFARILEKSGVEVSLMFYATNTYSIQLIDGESGLAHGYDQMSWNSYYTFHPEHAKFIEKVIQNKANFCIESKPIGLIDSIQDLQLPSGRKIALFDVQPFRETFLAIIGRPVSIYQYEISRALFSHLLEWCELNNTYLIIKPKREVDRRLCVKYRKMLDMMKHKKMCIIIDSCHSASKICSDVNAVVCQAFTSAALSAVNAGTPVIYYDPTSKLVPNQPACQGIDLLQGKDALYAWLSSKVLNSVY